MRQHSEPTSCRSTEAAGAAGVCNKTKKADVAKHLGVFDHVGLLFNEPPGIAELLFT